MNCPDCGLPLPREGTPCGGCRENLERWVGTSGAAEVAAIRAVLKERYTEAAIERDYKRHISRAPRARTAYEIRSILTDAYRMRIEREALLHRLEYLTCSKKG